MQAQIDRPRFRVPILPSHSSMDWNAKTRLRQAAQAVREGCRSGKQETAHGTLYVPKSLGLQFALLVASFIGGPALGWLLGLGMRDLTPAARLFLYIPPTLVFFLGYALWSARLAAIVFDIIGKSILRAIFRMIVRRERPRNAGDLLPDREKLTGMVVRAQKAGWSFLPVSVLVSVVCGPLSLLFNIGLSGAVVIVVGCLLLGYSLGLLGRRGCLPLPEPGN